MNWLRKLAGRWAPWLFPSTSADAPEGRASRRDAPEASPRPAPTPGAEGEQGLKSERVETGLQSEGTGGE